MQNITRTMTRFDINAYDIKKDENGVPKVTVIANVQSLASSMTKSIARSELAKATGSKLSQGVTIDWEPIEIVSYSLPLEKFLESASISKVEKIGKEGNE